MTLSIKNTMRSRRARALGKQGWNLKIALVPPRPMHETRRIILKKLYARLKSGHGFTA